MKFSQNDLIYFLGYRELEKESFKLQIKELYKIVEQQKKRLEFLETEHRTIVANNLIGKEDK